MQHGVMSRHENQPEFELWIAGAIFIRDLGFASFTPLSDCEPGYFHSQYYYNREWGPQRVAQKFIHRTVRSVPQLGNSLCAETLGTFVHSQPSD